jgi:hypothetical protein
VVLVIQRFICPWVDVRHGSFHNIADGFTREIPRRLEMSGVFIPRQSSWYTYWGRNIDTEGSRLGNVDVERTAYSLYRARVGQS